MELTLHDHSKLGFSWVRPGLLCIELWRPNSFKNGSLLLKASVLLDGAELADLLSVLRTGQEQPELPPAA